MEKLTKPRFCACNLFREVTTGTAKEMHVVIHTILILNSTSSNKLVLQLLLNVGTFQVQ